MNKKRSKVSELLQKSQPWANNKNDIWLASTVQLKRNVENFPFPGKMDSEQRNQIRALFSKPLTGIKELSNPILLTSEEIQPLDKEYLLEHYLSMQSFHQAHASEGFVIDETGKFLATINIGDHLHLQLTDCEGDIEESWNKLVAIETILGDSLQYAFNTKFGYLTSEPAHCGTGLLLHAFLHLPALIQTDSLYAALEAHCPAGIASSGIQGNPSQLVGDIVVLHNSHTLGLTEEEIVSSLRTALTKLIVAEKSKRKELLEEKNADIKDRVSRAYGLLMHSYQAETVESMNALSLLKLGVGLDWVSGVSIKQLNSLFFNCRRGHLLALSTKELAPEEVAHRRAELIHSELTQSCLNI